ncbi:hypothetical protein C8R43DRAFT_1164869 [Mycena crocata]|nr:hypothetical protein C8R43DRAFT_1164869 [Mycena crocata]
MTALQDPVVDQFQEMWHGKKILTYDCPEGELYRVAILAAIGDILALKKALGFAGHRSNNFCSFCKLQRHDIDRLDYTNFEPRSGAEILHWAKAWLLASTKVARKAIFKAHGCRGSSLNTLTYRDPVKHSVLGLMHNWLEGILQHHCRLKWGIGADASKKNTSFPSSSDGTDGSSSDSDVEMLDIDEDALAAELEQLHHDSSVQQDTPTSLQRSRSESFLFIRESDDTAADIELENAEEDDEDYQDDDDDIYASEKSGQKVFDSDSMASIHAGLAGVVIPSWIDRPPVNLGEKSHGKLKADNWLVLFTVFFPLIIPSFGTDKKLLDNFHDLIAATNILCSYAVIPAEADTYLEHYLNYLRSSKSLFPGLTTRPNHHYAIHNAAQMKWWGPLPKLAEFMYEGHNGSLQKIKTNNHMWELDLTMLRQICRRGRLLASIRDTASATNSNSFVAQVMRVLSPRTPASVDADTEVEAQRAEPTPDDTAYNGTGIRLGPVTYELIFSYWNQFHAPPYIHAHDLTYNLLENEINVFPTWGVQLVHFEHKTRLFSTFDKHHGNSSISFLHPSTGRKDIGFIQAIWSLSLQGEIHTFVAVQPHIALSAEDEVHTPYISHPKFECSVKYYKPSHLPPAVIIETRHVVSHVAYYPPPEGTFGIEKTIAIFVDSLHRQRD